MAGQTHLKIIKVGSTQCRVAQACDRCRSKKIRCDGVHPSCTPCASIKFECQTSDKLTRRAFPRGYTESLEERVRSLESEVNALKGMLSKRGGSNNLLSQGSSRPSSPKHASSSTPLCTSGSATQSPEDLSMVDIRTEAPKESRRRRVTTPLLPMPTSLSQAQSDTFCSMTLTPDPPVKTEDELCWSASNLSVPNIDYLDLQQQDDSALNNAQPPAWSFDQDRITADLVMHQQRQYDWHAAPLSPDAGVFSYLADSIPRGVGHCYPAMQDLTLGGCSDRAMTSI